MDSASETFIREAYLLVLARTPSEGELRDQLRTYEEGQERALAARFLSSPEFRLLRAEWQSGRGINRDPGAHEAGLRSIGPDERFVRLAYLCLFDRDADPEGLAAYTRALTQGLTRVALVETFVRSDEFERRYAAVATGGGFVPRDVQLCELANPAKWDNPEWMTLLRSFGDQPDHKVAMHRKTYEFTQLVFGLSRLGYLRDDVSVVSVGAGHESVLYWLANRVARVVATDMYDGVWQTELAREGDSRVLSSPGDYAPFPYRTDHLEFMRMDGRALDFPDGTFDVAYSLSSIEHFGGAAGATAAVGEMARVVKPGGILAVATEYLLAGPSYEEAFSPAEIRDIFGRPGLSLVQPIDERVYDRYQYTPVDLRLNRHLTPHMVVEDNGSVFTSVMVFLRRT